MRVGDFSWTLSYFVGSGSCRRRLIEIELFWRGSEWAGKRARFASEAEKHCGYLGGKGSS